MRRRDLLKAAATVAIGSSAYSQDSGGPFSRPTANFMAGNQDRLPSWAFSSPLELPLVPRPTFVGTFQEIHKNNKAFGPGDRVPVGDCFHGIAREWGDTPAHWQQEFGCDPSLHNEAAWADKVSKFGQVKSFDRVLNGGRERISNWGAFPIKCYKMPIVETLKQLRKDTAFPARMYSYGGQIPGPTLKMRLGQPVIVRYENHLESEVSVHLHGAHSPSHSDGFPSFYVLQGKARDYFYPNILPVIKATGEPDVGESQSTMWYHDHGMDATGYNVSKGLAGFAPCFGERELELIKSKVLPGLGEQSCLDPERDRLKVAGADPDPDRLEDEKNPGFYKHELGKEPYFNPYDIPLVLQDKVIDQATGQIAFDTVAHNGYLGDTFFVNGVAWPHHTVENRKYRLRFLNGSNARIYHLRLLSADDYHRLTHLGIDGPQEEGIASAPGGQRGRKYDQIAKDFLQIGKDSWLWSHALPRRGAILAMANRADIVVDFKQLAPNLKAGERAEFYLVNTMPQFDGRGPKVALDNGGDPRVLPLPFNTIATANGPVPETEVAELNRPIALMKFIVEGPPIAAGLDASIVAHTPLIAHDPIPDAEVGVVREFIFERGKGAWQINKRFYDPMIANATPTIGTAEEWVLRNGGGGWWHPIHIHLESHQLIRYEKDFQADQIIDLQDPPARPRLQNLVNVTDQIAGGPAPTAEELALLTLDERNAVLEARRVAEAELRGLHDTQILGPNTVVRIRMRFRTWNGPFVFHCHNLEHEDMRMMFNFEPVPRPHDSKAERTAENSAANVVPDARTHGNDVTLGGKTGELDFEIPPVPQTGARDAVRGLISPRPKTP